MHRSILLFLFIGMILSTLTGSATAQKGKVKLNEALFKACERDDPENIKELLAKGADPNARDKDGSTPLLLILDVGRFTGIYIVGQGSTVNNPDGTVSTSVTEMVDRQITPASSDTRAVELLLSHGAKVNVKDNGGTTPTMRAASHKTLACLKLLLSKGADIHAKTADGDNLISWAAGHGNAEMIRFLVKKGIRANTVRKTDGVTPLILEAPMGSVESVKALLEGGARINAKDMHGDTALSCAKQSGNTAVVQFLKKAGAK
jgi:ankyrin repeat protein